MEVKYLKPSVILLYTVILFNILPGLFIYINGEHEGLYKSISDYEYDTATELYLATVFSFIVCFSLSSVFFKLTVFKKSIKSHEIIENASFIRQGRLLFLKVLNNRRHMNYQINNINLIYKLAAIASFFTWIYFIFGGYEKLFSYGSNMDVWEYRIIGYGDRAGILTAILELSRKIFLPFACLYFLNLRTISTVYPTRIENLFFLFTLLLGGLMTLDRGPILLFCVMLFFKKYSLGASPFVVFVLPIISLCIVIGIGGLVTFLQYNITGFSFSDIVETGINFFWHRTVIVPSVASIELSFYIFPVGSEKLLLKFSRLGALFGALYVDIRNDELSLYVTPVGFIADCWRNFGYIGCLFLGLFLGFYFSYMDNLMTKLDPLTKIACSFTTISLCFYYIFGVFFSQGVFAQMIFLVFMARILKLKTPIEDKIKLDTQQINSI